MTSKMMIVLLLINGVTMIVWYYWWYYYWLLVVNIQYYYWWQYYYLLIIDNYSLLLLVLMWYQYYWLMILTEPFCCWQWWSICCSFRPSFICSVFIHLLTPVFGGTFRWWFRFLLIPVVVVRCWSVFDLFDLIVVVHSVVISLGSLRWCDPHSPVSIPVLTLSPSHYWW